MKIKILSEAYHRNGVFGEPFHVGLFQDEDGTTKVYVDFGGEAFAVLQVDLLAQGDVAFGSNSWRGDTFAGPVRRLCNRDATQQEA